MWLYVWVWCATPLVGLVCGAFAAQECRGSRGASSKRGVLGTLQEGAGKGTWPVCPLYPEPCLLNLCDPACICCFQEGLNREGFNTPVLIFHAEDDRWVVAVGVAVWCSVGSVVL